MSELQLQAVRLYKQTLSALFVLDEPALPPAELALAVGSARHLLTIALCSLERHADTCESVFRGRCLRHADYINAVTETYTRGLVTL